MTVDYGDGREHKLMHCCICIILGLDWKYKQHVGYNITSVYLIRLYRKSTVPKQSETRSGMRQCYSIESTYLSHKFYYSQWRLLDQVKCRWHRKKPA